MEKDWEQHLTDGLLPDSVGGAGKGPIGTSPDSLPNPHHVPSVSQESHQVQCDAQQGNADRQIQQILGACIG